MEFDHVTLKHRLKKLSKFGKKSMLGTAALLLGGAVGYKVWNQGGSFYHKVYATSSSRPEYKSSNWDANWDRRHTSPFATPGFFHEGRLIQKAEQTSGESVVLPKAKRHLLLIRHGQYNEEGDTDDERVLTEVGEFQARVTGRRLFELNLPYTRLVASTMSRARQTARLIQEDISGEVLDLEYDDILIEGAPVVPNPPTSNWKPQASQFFQDGARIESAFRKYFHRAENHQEHDSYELIVCHSNVIRYFVCRALQFPLSGWIRFSIANCSLTMITIHPDGLVMVEMLGDHGHIPAEGVTYH